MPSSLPLNENDEVRAVTWSCGILARRLRSSSVMPSEKYSWSLACDMSTNGSTAIELSLVAADIDVAVGTAEDAVAPAGTAAGATASLGPLGPPRCGPKRS